MARSRTEQTEQFFYFFSSNSRPLYLQNMLNVLALPQGAINRVRYDAPHLPGILARIPDESDDEYYNRLREYRGSRALIVMLTQPKVIPDTKTLPDEEMTFYPLRYARITDLRPDGRVLYLYYSIGSYVDWRGKEPRERTFDNIIKSTLDRDPKVKERPPTGYVSIKQLNFGALEQQIPRARTRDAASAWQALVDVLSEMTDLHNTIYYRIVGLHKLRSRRKRDSIYNNELESRMHPVLNFIPNQVESLTNWLSSSIVRWAGDMEYEGRVVPAILWLRNMIVRFSTGWLPIKEILPDANGYILRSGRNYKIDLSFYHSRHIHRSSRSELNEPVAGSILEPIVDKTYFAYIPAKIEVDFRYDTRSIDLIAGSLNQDTFTSVGIVLNDRTDTDSGDALPIRLTPSTSDSGSPTLGLAPRLDDAETVKLKAELQLPADIALPSQRTVSSHLNVPAMLRLSNKPPTSQDGEAALDLDEIPVRAAEVNLVLKLTYPRLGLVAAFILLVIGQLLVGLGSNLDNLKPLLDRILAPAPGQTAAVPSVDDLKAWGLVISLFGSVLTAFVLFRLLRKVPGS